MPLEDKGLENILAILKISWDRLVLEYSGTVKEKSLGLKEGLVIINFAEYLMCLHWNFWQCLWETGTKSAQLYWYSF